MVDRAVTVRLQVASQDFENGMLRAGTSVRVLSSELDQNSESAASSSEAMSTLAKVAAASGAALVTGFAFAEAAVLGFDKQMSATGAAAGATAAQMHALREAALDAGQATSFSATQAAEGEEELAKAGVSTAAIVGGALTGALNLAAAGGLDVAEAAETAATAMTIFGLSGKDVPHIADLLTNAANNAQGSVHDLGMALQQSALVANQTGLSIDDTATALALFASNGLTGSDAGTSFKTMLQSLNPRSKEAATLMDQLGISAYDSGGNFVGLSTYAGKLQTALSGMSAEQRNATMQTIFGADAVRAATALYQSGSAGVDKWSESVRQQGTATDTAAKRMDNLAGDLEKLRGSIETSLIRQTDGATGSLRFLTQQTDYMVQGLGAMPSSLGTAATGFAGIGGSALVAAGALGIILPKIDATRASLAAGGAMSQRMATGIGYARTGLLASIPVLAVAAIALDLYGRKQAESKQRVTELTEAIRQDNGVLGDNTRAKLASSLATNGIVTAARTAGISEQTLIDTLSKGTSVTKEYVATLEAKRKALYADQSGNHIKEADALNVVINALKGNSGALQTALGKAQDYDLALGKSATTATTTASAQERVTGALGVSTDQMKSQKDAADSLREALDMLSGNNISVAQSEIAFKDGLQDISDHVADNIAKLKENKDALDSNATSLDGNTQTGRDNQRMILNQITTMNDWATKQANAGATTEQVTAKYNENREALRLHLIELGYNEQAVNDYIAAMAATPAQLATTVVLAGVDVTKADLDEINRKMGNLNNKQVTMYVRLQTLLEGATPGSAAAARAGEEMSMIGQAAGGLVRGPGTGTSDSVPRMLSNGEYVLQASAVNALGVGYLDALNSGRVMTPVGGSVSQQAASSVSAGNADLLVAVRSLERRVDEQTQLLTAAAFGSTTRLADTLDRRAMAGSSDVSR